MAEVANRKIDMALSADRSIDKRLGMDMALLAR